MRRRHPSFPNANPVRPISLLTVVVPVYNEAQTIREALNRLLTTELPLLLEVVVVDDASTDGSISDILDLIEEGAVRLIAHDRNRGKGAAVRTGIAEATGDLLTILDADLECDPEDYPSLVRPILDGQARVVYGSRPLRRDNSHSLLYVLGNRSISLWASALYKQQISDVETCFKVATTELWRSLDLHSNGFGIEAEATAKFLRGREHIHEVPIAYQARTREDGKKIRWTDGLAALWILLRVRIFGK